MGGKTIGLIRCRSSTTFYVRPQVGGGEAPSRSAAPHRGTAARPSRTRESRAKGLTAVSSQTLVGVERGQTTDSYYYGTS
jgi:hypothetical protein